MWYYYRTLYSIIWDVIKIIPVTAKILFGLSVVSMAFASFHAFFTYQWNFVFWGLLGWLSFAIIAGLVTSGSEKNRK